MILNIDPKNDYIFKKLFGSEENHSLLMNLLQAVLTQYLTSPIQSVEILNPFNEKDGLNDKLSVLDIKARDQSGKQFNVEMQLFPHRSYPERALYYWARLYHQQLHEGEDYSKLKTTFVISFVDFILFPKVADYHLDFQLLSKKHPELVFSSQLNLHLIELPKFRLAVNEVSTPLEQWCYFLRHGMNFETTALPETLKAPEIKNPWRS